MVTGAADSIAFAAHALEWRRNVSPNSTSAVPATRSSLLGAFGMESVVGAAQACALPLRPPAYNCLGEVNRILASDDCARHSPRPTRRIRSASGCLPARRS